MELNKYNLYSYNANEKVSITDDKILVDIQKMKSITEFEDIEKYVKDLFGEIGNRKVFKFENNVILIIEREENLIKIGALQNDKQIFGQSWALEEIKE